VAEGRIVRMKDVEELIKIIAKSISTMKKKKSNI